MMMRPILVLVALTGAAGQRRSGSTRRRSSGSRSGGSIRATRHVSCSTCPNKEEVCGSDGGKYSCDCLFRGGVTQVPCRECEDEVGNCAETIRKLKSGGYTNCEHDSYLVQTCKASCGLCDGTAGQGSGGRIRRSTVTSSTGRSSGRGSGGSIRRSTVENSTRTRRSSSGSRSGGSIRTTNHLSCSTCPNKEEVCGSDGGKYSCDCLFRGGVTQVPCRECEDEVGDCAATIRKLKRGGYTYCDHGSYLAQTCKASCGLCNY